jgi:hypothetical protein
MNKFTLNVTAGGIFSKFMFLIQNIQRINTNFESVYLNNIDEKSLTNVHSIFNAVFDQEFDESLPILECHSLENYSKFNPIEGSLNLNDYKNIVSKLKFNNKFIELFNSYLNEFKVDETYIGVHIRLCDMNIYHGHDYGVLTYNDFFSEILKYKNDTTKLFVASDNSESLIKLKKEFGDDLFYIENFVRSESETQDTTDLQLAYFKDEEFWMQAFIEMLMLSKCGTLICRTSNLNNASIIYSDSIKTIVRI